MYHNYKMAKTKKNKKKRMMNWPVHGPLSLDKGRKFLKKKWHCVNGEYNKILWFYELSYCVNWLP